MSERNTLLLLEDIVESIEKILSYTREMTFDHFMSDSKTIDAVIRNFSILGEAANKIPAEFRLAHPEIEWHRIRGFRNRIVHQYFDIDYEILWQIIQENLPGLKEKINLLFGAI